MFKVSKGFEKVPKEEWLASWEEGMCDYKDIKLPVRKTKGSAGYDFYSTRDFVLNPGESVVVKTGVCCPIEEGWFLGVFPKSGLGFKYRLQLANTVGIIDSDYYGCESNAGHILIKITNDSKDGRVIDIKSGMSIAQGIFLPYGVTMDDTAEVDSEIRKGGYGSTGKY